MNDLDLTMSLEYSAWCHIVEEWEALSLPDFNSENVNPLVVAIRLWGERLAAIRVTETDQQRERSLGQAECAYERLGG